MNFENYSSLPIPRWGSQVDTEPAAVLPLGVATVAKNVKFTRATVRTRDGIEVSLQSVNKDQPIAGMAELIYLAITGKNPLFFIYDRGGRLEVESPAGSGTSVAVDPGLYVLQAGLEMIESIAQNRAYMAFSDLQTGTKRPGVYNGDTNTFQPAGGRPTGENWSAIETYLLGEIVTPTAANGRVYRCTTPGISGAAEPAWPVPPAPGVIVDGTCQWTETNLTPTDTVLPSSGTQFCAGPRFMFIVYKTTTGYICGVAENAVFSFTSAGGVKVQVPLPIGPANTLARIVCFTVSGGSKAGPYFWIPSNDSFEGVAQTATIINNNVDVTATFDFSDDYLLTGRDGTDYFNRGNIPKCVSMVYDKTLTRMVYTGCPGFESAHLISDPTDLEAVNAVNGVIQVAQQDGEKTMGWGELDGAHISLKERSGHIVQAGDADPRKWSVTERWRGSGPCGPRAWAVGLTFLAYVHRTGVFLFSGDKPWNVTDADIRRTFKRINWNAQQRIWVTIDDDKSEMLIGLPLDDATECTHILRMNYLEGWDAPVILRTSRTTKSRLQLVAGARKWSLDTIAATMGRRLHRTLAISIDEKDTAIDVSQFAYGMFDGAVCIDRPGTFADNGQGIDSVYESGTARAGGVLADIAGIRLKAAGAGNLQIAFLLDDVEYDEDLKNKRIKRLRAVDLVKETGRDIDRGAVMMASSARVRFSNGNAAGSGFELQSATIYASAWEGGA